MAPEALIFDMDGVITDSEPLQVEAERWVCEKYGIPVPHSEWIGFKGKTNRDIFTYIVENFSGKPHRIDELIESKRARYIEISRDKMLLVPGSVDFIRYIRVKVPKLALTTSSSRAVQQFVFDRYELHRYFDESVTGDEVRNGKPHPEPYRETLRKLNIEPHAAVVIEDSDNGIIAAKAAGCAVIGITTSFPRETLLAHGADVVVDSFDEMYALFA